LHPIRNIETIHPKRFKKISDKRYLYDLGRNISGVSKITLQGEAGTTVRLLHSEILRPNDSLDISNIAMHYRPTDDSDPFATDIYILKGKGEEEFMPRFNYKGFQYVEVTADRPINLTEKSLAGIYQHSDLPKVGSVETSNPLLNRIWEAANNSYIANMFGYPTDCPQREKNGWTGDANYAVELGLYNYDGITVYEKWMADHRDEQQPNGFIPIIVPTSGWGMYAGPDWTGSVALIPWAVYEFYGDRRLLETMYEPIRRYIDRTDRLSPDGICDLGLADWISFQASTPQKFTTTIYYYRIVSILAKTAKLLGKTDDFEKYSLLAEKIKSAFNEKYLNRETAIYEQGTQTEMSTALIYGLTPDSLRQRVADNLASRIREKDNGHLNLGLIGSRAIFHALSENGYADLAAEIASQDTYPSLGYWIAKDSATTLYESWKAIGEEPESSLNHIMFGEVNAWFYKALGGIRTMPESAGFQQFILQPHFVKNLTFAKIEYDSPCGKIVSHWQRKGKNKIDWHIVVPANCSAKLILPKGYRLSKAVLPSGEKVDLPQAGEGYELEAGEYWLKIEFSGY